MRKFIAALIIGLWPSAALSQDVPTYEPNALPLKMQSSAISPCGVRVGVDPRWTVAREQTTDTRGQQVHEIKYSVGPDHHLGSGAEAAKFVLHSQLYLTVRCAQAKWSDETLATYADSFHRSARARTGQRPTKLEALQSASLGTVFRHQEVSRSNSGSLSDTLHLSTLHNEQLVTLSLRVSRTPPKSYRKKLRAGREVSLQYPDGRIFTFRLASNARQDPFTSTVGAERSKDQNKALFDAITNSLRAK